MAVITSESASKAAFRYGNPVVACGDAEVRAQCRQLATVLTVSGVIDEFNVDLVAAQARRCILPEKPFILDLSGIVSFALSSIELLDKVNDSCFAAGIEWSLVAAQPVTHVLLACGDEAAFPTATSVAEALHHFSDSMYERRRLLPFLTKKSA
ncbi:anti-anti-sigma regulatory factor [Mycobacterium sp. MAA66]|jgi:anti-anti-sigma regulatory factor|uniref:STAS domain-containing protein n=1 Tax=Mycobacterium sp. MAA66 TaxID=3156297 RepID=UPI003519C740